MEDKFLITLTPEQLINLVNNGIERKQLYDSMAELKEEVENLKNEIAALRSRLET